MKTILCTLAVLIASVSCTYADEQYSKLDNSKMQVTRQAVDTHDINNLYAERAGFIRSRDRLDDEIEKMDLLIIEAEKLGIEKTEVSEDGPSVAIHQ